MSVITSLPGETQKSFKVNFLYGSKKSLNNIERSLNDSVAGCKTRENTLCNYDESYIASINQNLDKSTEKRSPIQDKQLERMLKGSTEGSLWNLSLDNEVLLPAMGQKEGYKTQKKNGEAGKIKSNKDKEKSLPDIMKK